jgi:hypothetical protein
MANRTGSPLTSILSRGASRSIALCGIALGLITALESRAQIGNYQTYSGPKPVSLSDAQARLLEGFELCKPNGWIASCKQALSQATAVCEITTESKARVGKVEFISLGAQTQVIASILSTYPATLRDQRLRDWLRYIEGKAKDRCPVRGR